MGICKIGVSPKHVLISLCKLQKQDEAKLACHPGKLAWYHTRHNGLFIFKLRAKVGEGYPSVAL